MPVGDGVLHIIEVDACISYLRRDTVAVKVSEHESVAQHSLKSNCIEYSDVHQRGLLKVEIAQIDAPRVTYSPTVGIDIAVLIYKRGVYLTFVKELLVADL